MQRNVSPACAGMIPVQRYGRLVAFREPRMRGDDPALPARIQFEIM